MAKSTKFGTFAGVFTPAILTILGVIMYLRLPWVVGNGGLWMTIGIVAVAHLVSVTTGLSVSSMATDKRVKAGGSYYILSRSLGLPIGGALGIALFVGLSFSVSLYVIGFSESFLGYFGHEANIDNIRMVGSGVLAAVTIVTLISTALAMKMQFFIMAAIAISLASVLIGSDAPPPTTMHLEPIAGGVGFAVLFGVFFPAVTGFEAGVSMSGDLKDPKKSIPGGTMAAIAVGLIVYVALGAFLAWRIPAEELANNPRVLLDYAWIEELVLPGIWGATISSALGSILGAPRILQACAADGIGPRFFERGHGAANEPRRALILTALLAWAGVLVGELDTIARVVSMFFLTSYGFLNLAAFFESWVSPDFRPEFRIPRTVSLIGAATCFTLMIQMDIAAMIAATLAMALLYALIKRRELALEAGDTWSGVWAALVRWSLGQLAKGDEHERNWRPRVLSFGGESVRALSEQLAGRGGFVSDLSSEIQDHSDGPWAARKSAAEYHGLPGLRPNVVLLSVDELVETPAPALEFVESLDQSQYNTIVTRGRSAVVPGRIDIWWRGRGGSISLALALVRSITTHRPWRRAGVRFYLPVSSPAERRVMERRISHLLEQSRVHGDIRTVDPSVMPPIQKLSADAALVILGLPLDTDAGRWATRIQDLVNDVPNCVLVRPSTNFKNPLGERSEAVPATPAILHRVERDEPWSRDTVLAEMLNDLETGLAEAFIEPFQHGDRELFAPLAELATELEHTAERTARKIQKLRGSDITLGEGAVGRLQTNAWSEIAERVAAVSLTAASHHTWLMGAMDSSERALGDVVLSSLRAIRLKRVDNDGVPDVAVAEGRVDRLIRARTLYLQAELNELLAQAAPAALESSAQRLVAARLDLVTAVHSAAVAVARSLRTEEADDESWRDDVEELRSRIESTRRNEAAAALAVARTMVERMYERMQAPPRRILPPRAVSVTDWVDAEDIAETLAPRLAAVDDALDVSRLELRMELVLRALRAGTQDAVDRLRERLQRGVLDDLHSLRRALEREQPELPSSRRGAEFDAGPALLDISRTVESAVAEVPDTIRVVPEVVLAHIEADAEFDDSEVRTIAVRQLVGYVLETDIVAGSREDARKVERAARRAEDLLRDVARMHAAAAAADNAIEEDATALAELRARAEEVDDDLQSAETAFRESLNNRLDEVATRLNASQIVAESSQLSRFVRSQAQRQIVTSALASISRWRMRASQRLVDLSHRWDAGWESVQDTRGEGRGVVEECASFQREVSPRPRVLQELPVFCRRTFRAHTLDSALLVGDGAIERARASIEHHEAGSQGALLISGSPGAGTTTIARRVVSELLHDRPLVEVRPRSAATGSVEQLHDAIRSAVRGTHSTAHSALRSLSRGSVILVHDIDLWWLRGPTGLGALEELHQIVDTYSTRFVFILTAQSSTVSLLRRLELLESLLLGHIQAQPLDAATAMDAVMRRQRATGYDVRFENGEFAAEFALARYFSSLRQMTGGAVGPLIAAWLAHFDGVDATSITVRDCEPVRMPFGVLPLEWVPAVSAVALHRRVELDDLRTILGPEVDIDQIVATLQRAHVFKFQHGIVELDEAMRPFVVRWLTNQGMLA